MTATPAPARKHGKNAFMFVVITVFIDMMGFAVIMPVLPKLVAELTHGKTAFDAAVAAHDAGDGALLSAMIAEAVPWGGFISAAFAIVNFLTQPVLGNLSDRYGRRPVLLVSMATLAIDFLIMGFAHALWLLFLGRILSGLSSATHSTASAYIADTTEPAKRAQAYGMLGAAFGFGFIFGPVIGGFLGEIDSRAPFFASAGLAALNFLYGLFVLPESLAPENRRAFDWKRANALGAFRHFYKLPHLSWLILAYGLFFFGHWVYPATFAYYGPIRYGWDERMTGLVLGAVGVGAAIVQAGLIRPAIKKLGATRTMFIGLITGIAVYVAYGLANEGWMVFAIVAAGALGGFYSPAMNQILTSRVEANAQGELQGALASIQALGNIFSPILMTQTLHHFTSAGAPVYLPGAAFFLAAGITLLAVPAIIIGLRNSPKVAQAPDAAQAGSLPADTEAQVAS
jgi:DHA1 family tetracycline resistance protein-like MFS transporter